MYLKRWTRGVLALAVAVSSVVGLGGGVGAARVAWAQERPAAAAVAAEKGHLFRFDARGMTPKPKAVFLAGTFNGWNSTGEPMADDGTGVFTLRRELSDGVYYYKFVVDGNWTTDPNGDKELEQDDTFGGKNSAVLVGPDARKLPPPPAGTVRPETVRFDLGDLGDFNVINGELLRVGLRTQAKDADGVRVVVFGKGGMKLTDLSRGETTLGMERWGGLVPLERDGDGKLRFMIEFRDGGKSVYWGPGGVAQAATPERAYVTDAKLTFATPEWSKHAVWYQIFPERFRNGDPSNDPGDKPGERLVPWTGDWWKPQPGEPTGDENFYKGTGNVWQRRYGGDVQGVREKLAYLRSLGVTAIYFNPMFEASSMHKYDARDFRHIDDNFTVKGSLPQGELSPDPKDWKWSEGDKLFLDFVAEAKRQGFHVVLDLVCNHVGRDHPYFQDVVEKGAKSPYASWFQIDKFADVHPTTEELFGKPGGLQFKAWDQPSGHLPAFKHDPVTGLAAGPYEHMMNVTRRWLAPGGDVSRGVDGFRLDVANEVPSEFWRRWRKVVKETNPDAYIAGEIWSPAQQWLQGDQFDGVMNYQFAMAGQRFFVNRRTAAKPTEFARELERLTTLYPLQSVMALMNLYDSHDTDRLASMFVNPDRPYDGQNRIQDNGPDYSPRKPTPEEWERFKQAVSFQMTFIGSPMIYYGSEAGMWSPDDPSNRMPMVWKDLEPYAQPGVAFDQGIFDHYRRAIAVRRALPALQAGYVRVLSADDATGVVAFAREDRGDATVVVINRSGKEVTVGVPTAWSAGTRVIDWLNPDSTELVTPEGTDARPVARARGEAMRHVVNPDGTIGLTIRPWGTAVLAAPERKATAGR